MEGLKIRCTRCGDQDPFYSFTAKTVDEAVQHLRETFNRRTCNYTDFFVTIGANNSLLYEPWFGSFKDWNGMRWVQVFNLEYYFTRY